MADALFSFLHADETHEARLGGLLVAEFLNEVHAIYLGLSAKPKKQNHGGNSVRGRRRDGKGGS